MVEMQHTAAPHRGAASRLLRRRGGGRQLPPQIDPKAVALRAGQQPALTQGIPQASGSKAGKEGLAICQASGRPQPGHALC